MKPRKRLILLEDFKTLKTTDASNIANVTEVPVNNTRDTSTRNGVIADVDSILNNLETLSAQITEETDAILENTDWYAKPLNENFMEDMIKTFKSMKSYARLSSSWPRMYQDKLDLEIEGVNQLGAFALKALDKEEEMLAAVKAKFDAKKKDITASNIPTEKKKVAREAINAAYKQNEVGIKDKIKKQVKIEEDILKKKQEQATTKLGLEMTEFEDENTIDSELLKKRWKRSEVEQSNAMDNAHIKAKAEAELAFMDEDDPEAIKKFEERKKKAAAEMEAEDAARLKEVLDDLKSAEAEAEERAKAGTEKEKEANAKILTFYKTANTLKDALKSTNPEEYDDAAKLNIKTLKAAFDAAESKVSGTVFIDGGVADDKAQGEEIADDMKQGIKELLADFREVLNASGGAKSDLEKATEAANTEVGTAQETLDTEELTGDDVKIKAANIKLLDAKIAHETAKKAEAADKGEDTTKFDTKIAEHEAAKKLLDNKGNDDQNEDVKSAEDVATEELGAAKADYEKIDDPEEKEPDTTDADGNTVPGRKKWTDIKTFKGKDAEGADTGEEVIYAKKNDSQSAATVTGIKLNEGMSVAEKFAILMNR